MFGFVVGTLCLVGLFGLMKASFHHRHHHAWGHSGWGGHHGLRGHGGHGSHGGGWGRGGWHGGGEGGWGRGRGRGRGGWAFEGGFGRAAAEIVKRRLRVDEDQEGIVDHAIADLQAAGKEYVEVLKDSRKDLAAAFAGEAVDEAAIAAVFARHDEELAKARRDAVSALKQVHGVLDPDQRKAATEWLGNASLGGGRPGWV